jgi:hypothetical protein
MKNYLTIDDLPNLDNAVAEALTLKKDPYKYNNIGKTKL